MDCGQQKVGELFGEVFHRRCLRASCEGVDGVFHRVGRQDFAVVAVKMGGVKVSLEEHLNRPLAQVVAVFVARDLHQADAGFSVAILNELDHRSGASIGGVAVGGEKQMGYGSAVAPQRQ